MIASATAVCCATYAPPAPNRARAGRNGRRRCSGSNGREEDLDLVVAEAVGAEA
jgi:hypothetical protein